MKQTIYGFLEDDALRLSATLDLNGSSDQGFGSLTGEPLNYLVAKGTIGDGRSERTNVLDSSRARGHMGIVFDQQRVDLSILKQLTGDDNRIIFNILERVYFQQNLSDDNIEKLLSTAGDYEGYVENSFIHSTDESTIKAYTESGVEKNILVKHWVAFDYKVANLDDPVTFHIYLSKDTFKKSYPFVTILRVTPPYEPKLLIDPTTLVETVNTDIMNNSSSYIFGQLNTELAIRDQSGTYQFPTKYVINANRSHNIVFGITYAGAHEPTSLECRQAIKDFLLDATKIDAEALQPIFPELFIEARYYIVPLWDRYTQLADRMVYPSISHVNSIFTTAGKIFNNYEDKYIRDYLEVLTNAQNKMLSFAVPDKLNKENHLSLRAEYDTYQDYSTQSTGWKYMPLETQEFAGKLIRCMAVASGVETSTEFDKATESNLAYLVFLTGAAEFYLLTKDSYNIALSDA